MRLGLNGTGPAGCQEKSLDPPRGGTLGGVGLNNRAVLLQVRPQRLKRRSSDHLNYNLHELPNHHANDQRNDPDVSHEQSVRPILFSFSLHNRFLC